MKDFFRKIKIRKYKSVYDRIIDLESKGTLEENSLVDYYKDKKYIAGSYEYDYLKDRIKIENKKTNDLNKAIGLYYKKDPASIVLICDFFNKNKAQESIHGFESYILSQDVFDEQKLLGLSILLMRDTNSIEAVKFGIILSRYYQLKNAEAAIKIIKDLGVHPEFTYYSLSALKVLKNYNEISKDIRENTIGLGKEIKGLI